ncbi:MAG TPA: TIGR01459 family HAD-type hydrolase [Xanthobacteraceae bacterium]|nr:TIGR01459 family HAD-type hydrolase [Xanthobacteraceae bacterium]
MTSPTSPQFINGLSEITAGVDIVLSDVWGVLHDGLVAFQDASAALKTFRDRGGKVVLITNAPRPADSVQRQLRKFGVADETYDAIVSSGDLTRNYIAERPGQKVFAIGPGRDTPIYRGLDIPFSDLETADYIVCTGPFDDDTETAEDYRDMMMKARDRGLTFICANPDIVVERGDRLITCAGAIAELYASIGGDVIFFGKPHRPIYERAIALANGPADGWGGRVLAIGDSIRTDVSGANAAGIDCIFLTRGIHAEEFAGLNPDDPAAIAELFANGAKPRAVMTDLRW